jgi:Domain of unknown function (DUF1918)
MPGVRTGGTLYARSGSAHGLSGPSPPERTRGRSEVSTLTNRHQLKQARVGDLIEARGLHGRASRRGEIVELLGSADHRHYRVRWDETHESIVYPADGVLIKPRRVPTLGALAEESD